MIKKIRKWTLLFLLVLVFIYLLGPRAKFDTIDDSPLTLDIPLDGLDDYISDLNQETKDIKLGNEAQIIWADSTKSKTEYSVVYLHGFSASEEEGDPIHKNFAQRYGANLYLPRLYDHGRATKDAFKNLTPQNLINSAKEAIAIGKLLGEKVILMSCSTGGTYSIILAPNDPAVHALIMYSPNIDLYDPTSALVTKPWGKQLLKIVLGGETNKIAYDSLARQYWSDEYHLDGIVAVKALTNETMTDQRFHKVDIPFYMGYYYENEEHQDKVVSVERMLDFYNQSSTANHLKRKEALTLAKKHVMTSRIFSNYTDTTSQKLYDFADDILGLSPVKSK